MMRRYVAPIALVIIAGCSATSQSVPRYDDTPGFTRVMYSLSPWKDGSPDRSHDGRTPGDYEADRQTFARWYLRYVANEALSQHDENYKPFDVPGTVREAIAQQHVVDDAELAAQAAVRDRNQREEERQAANDRAYERAGALRDQQAAAEQQAASIRDQAEANRQAAKDERDGIARQQAADRSEADSKCRQNAREAGHNAASKVAGDGSGIVPNDVFHRVFDSFHCRPEN